MPSLSRILSRVWHNGSMPEPVSTPPAATPAQPAATQAQPAAQPAATQAQPSNPTALSEAALRAALDQAVTAQAAAERTLAVYSATPAGVDVQQLLDSRAFGAVLDSLPATATPADMSTAITQFVGDADRYRAVPHTPATPAGVADAAQRTGSPRPTITMDSWLRGIR